MVIYVFSYHIGYGKGSMSDTSWGSMPTGKTEVKIFSVDDIAQAMENKRGDVRFRIPKFQRGIVWNESKRKKLIDSIKNGYPVGSILLYKESEDTYRLIDGLQRCSSLFRYVKSPILHMDTDAIQDLEEFKSLKSELEELAKQSDNTIRDQIIEWIDGLKREKEGFEALVPTTLNMHLMKSGLFDAADLINSGNTLQKFCDAIKQAYSIGGYPVPAVIYSGDTSTLSDIFERINVQGTRLSTLQILAAQWNETEVNFDHNDPLEASIQEANNKRFESLSEEGFEITKNTDEDSLDLYEYLFGLGKILCERGGGVLKSNGITEPDTIGFYLCGIWNRVPPGKLDSLPDKIGEGSLRPFSVACEEATKMVDNWFKSTYTLRLNKDPKKGAEIWYPHSENQMISIIGRVMLEMYDPQTGEKRESWKESKDEMKKACIALYLMDNINDHWKGSGDSKMFGRSWTEDENGENVLSGDYRHLPSISTVHDDLKSWYNKQYESQQRERVTYSNSQKLFLKYIYREKVAHAANLEDTFHLEHINSVKYMKDKILEDGSGGWPMSIISNLMLLPKNINETKGEASLKEHWVSLSEDEKERVSRYLISPVEDIPDRDSLDEASYVTYFHRRWNDHILPEMLKRLGYAPDQIEEALKG